MNVRIISIACSFPEGNVEARFLYCVLTSTELVPFGHLPLRIAILPIEVQGKNFRLIDSGEAESRGFQGLAEWLKKCEMEWKNRGGAKNKIDVYGWLNYRNKLTRQNPEMRFRVVYPMSATNLVASVIDLQRMDLSMGLGDSLISMNGLVMDYKVFYCDVRGEDEAFYLCAVLNSRVIDEIIKPMQSRGLFGPRDITKKPLELPIPRYNHTNTIHKEISELGKKASKVVYSQLPKITDRYKGKVLVPQHVARIRKASREFIMDILDQIDENVASILETSNVTKLEQFIEKKKT